MEPKKNNYISHLITDELNHSIVFDADDQDIKCKLIDYLAIYSNNMLITKIVQTHDVLIDNTVLLQYRIFLKCDIKEARALINFLRD